MYLSKVRSTSLSITERVGIYSVVMLLRRKKTTRRRFCRRSLKGRLVTGGRTAPISGRWQPRQRLRFSSVCFVGPNPSNEENNAIERKKERTEVRPCLGFSVYLTVM